MEEDINTTEILGTVEYDPDFRPMKSGNDWLSFKVKTVTNADNDNEKVSFDIHEVKIFDTEIVERLKEGGLAKGSRVHVMGSNKSRKYVNRDGVTVYTYNPYAKTAVLLGGLDF